MYCQGGAAAAGMVGDPSAMMDPNPYNPYHHPYYRVGTTGVKDHHHHHHHQSVESAAQAAAVQTRILEMRKEKSRDAARSRRGKENHEFYELAKMLPLPAAITSQLDKASIIRLTISYLKLRDFSSNGEPSWNGMSNGGTNLSALKLSKSCNMFELHQGTHILQSLDGFAFALGHDGRFLYISETVSIYLGLSQVEMTGSSVFDYTHQQDHAELAEQLGLNMSSSSGGHHLSSSPLPPASVGSSASNESDGGTPYSHSHSQMVVNGSNDTMEREFCIRMKSTLTKRGCQHFKSSGYRVVHIIAHLRPEMPHQIGQQRRDGNGGGQQKIIGMVAVAIALPPPSINELRLEPDMFVTRLGLDFRIAHCEPRVSDLLNYTADELTGRNLYGLIHGQDVMHIRKSHLDLIHKGQVMTNYYRFINKTGGFTWMQSCATLISTNTSTTASAKAAAATPTPTTSSTNNGSNGGSEDHEQSIICVNYVLSAVEYNNIVMDTIQLTGGSITPTSPTGFANKRNNQTMKRSVSSTPSPDANSTQHLSHSQPPCVDHNNTHMSPHSSQRSSLPPPPLPAPVSVVSVHQQNGSPGSPVDVHHSESAKRRRFNSSPVRPWKSPSPPNVCQTVPQPVPPGSVTTIGTTSSEAISSASSLLRHISVIRETPPILKPQVVAPTYHPHAHHYHPLVDSYAAAYHLYKNGTGGGPPMTAQPTPAVPTAASHHHHWGAYN
ncbi:protein trachealess-like isoform X2 [Oppia nitens]|uniref:protein trachealess-like isoform X2 n=1 Tax=Oppia nitens TaxID=1686743 RepID=UPI0023DA1215|nr:protein trachealess-like isoform X2 [Oppia nitens]